MSTSHKRIAVRGVDVDLIRKDIKNLHVGVYPPDGRVRVAAPLHLEDEAIRLAVITRLSWIRKQQARFKQQQRQSDREMVTGESHYYQGQRYRLNVIEHNGPPLVRLSTNTKMELRVRPGTDRAKREAILHTWYRDRLREQVASLLTIWEPRVGVTVSEVRIKRMKTRWGSCNSVARRVWLNLELAKKTTECLEYVLVHELVHLRHRHHDTRFQALLDELMPQWSLRRDELNSAPLGHKEWSVQPGRSTRDEHGQR